MPATTIPPGTLPAFIAVVVLSSGAAEQPAAPGPNESTVPPGRAAIHFVEYGGIRNWRADDDDALYIEALNRKWYKATFFGPCHGLRSAISIGFVSDSGGSVDRFSSIVVREPGPGPTECHFRTFAEIPAPPKPASKKPVKGAPATAP